MEVAPAEVDDADPNLDLEDAEGWSVVLLILPLLLLLRYDDATETPEEDGKFRVFFFGAVAAVEVEVEAVGAVEIVVRGVINKSCS